MVLELARGNHSYDVRNIVQMISDPPKDAIFIAAHRGLRWKGAADNSRAAVKAAVASGIECVEIDIQLSKDGVPVVFHDDGLGRSTDIGERSGRAGSGYNPLVQDVLWEETIRHLHLKEEHGIITEESVLDLAGLLEYIRTECFEVVVLLDIKTKDAIAACFEKIRSATNHRGVHALEWCLWKLDASWYPTTADLEASSWFKQAAAEVGYHPLLMPVIRPETAGLFDYMQCAKLFSTKTYTVAFEVGLRSPGGFLQDVVDFIMGPGCPVRSMAFFAPLGDLHPPDHQPILYDLGNLYRGGESRDWVNEWSFSDNRPPRSIHTTLRPGDSVDGRDHRKDIPLYCSMGFNIVISKASNPIEIEITADHGDKLRQIFTCAGWRNHEGALAGHQT